MTGLQAVTCDCQLSSSLSPMSPRPPPLMQSQKAWSSDRAFLLRCPLGSKRLEGIASRASLPLVVLLATGGTAGRARAVPASFGVPGALPPAAWGHSFRRAGPIDAARKMGR